MSAVNTKAVMNNPWPMPGTLMPSHGERWNPIAPARTPSPAKAPKKRVRGIKIRIAVKISATPVSILICGSKSEMPDLSAIIEKIGLVAPNFCAPKNKNPAATTIDNINSTFFIINFPRLLAHKNYDAC